MTKNTQEIGEVVAAKAGDKPAKVDVLVPVYNGADTVEESLNTILAQTFEDFRIVVVNDGSSDGTADILARMAEADSRIHVITQENGGIVDALNTGLKVCTAEYVARHDADDIAFPNRLEEQVKHLDANRDCIALAANAFHIDVEGKRLKSQSNFEPEPKGDPNRYPAREPYLLHPFLLLRRQILQDVGGFRYVYHSEDTDLYWRLLEHGKLQNRDMLGEYRVHPGSITSKSALNGRVGAVFSQLSALSYLRRKAGRHDIEFSKLAKDRFQPNSGLPEIIAAVSDQLDPQEIRKLTLASVAKYQELLLFRPYSPSLQDCLYIKRILSELGHLAPLENRLAVRARQVALAQVFLKRKEYAHARAISPLSPVAYAAFLAVKAKQFRKRPAVVNA